MIYRSTNAAQLKQFKPQMHLDEARHYPSSARTYFYLDEAQCEKNMEIFLRCIDAVAGATAHTGFAAIKLTALGRPQLLLQLSEVIARTRMFFTEVTGEHQMALGQISPQEFKERLDQRFHIQTDNPDVRRWLDTMDYDRRGLMNIFSWNGLVDMQRMMSDVFTVLNIRSGRIEKVIAALSHDEEEMFRNMMRRVHTIARHARQADVRVMIDAEQSYFQPAINRITMELMRKYNTEKPIVFNTYQCYLKVSNQSGSIWAISNRNLVTILTLFNTVLLAESVRNAHDRPGAGPPTEHHLRREAGARCVHVAGASSGEGSGLRRSGERQFRRDQSDVPQVPGRVHATDHRHRQGEAKGRRDGRLAQRGHRSLHREAVGDCFKSQLHNFFAKKPLITTDYHHTG